MPVPIGASMWTQPPLFQPDWIVIELKLHVTKNETPIWGGFQVTDGDTGELLAITAEAFRSGHTGLDVALTYLRQLAEAHMESGDPFPP